MRSLWLILTIARILESILGDRVCHPNDTDISIPGQRSQEILSRRRRLTFPMGSTFVATVSILQAIPVKLPSNWNLAFEFDVIWPIPPQESFRKKYHKKRPWMVKRRHRRELYATFETALDSRNLPGRQCVLRTICEARTLLSSPGVSFVEDVIRLILSNTEKVKGIDSYDVAYRTEMPCDVVYPCPISLLKLLFNLYSDDLG
ncbi:uncharacterized protein LOC122532265 isoform X1 [Frieseomelitta varia]|uniref:uncharacterized protein LOC122532265 isoform X1 n=1 Tax=Frieseomelitta varia TaxID=561572 RepID=UPI001CB67D24|nr:uncharacterized protein LOC122532265 isoform X1 [Frieseomelitta varia]